MWGEKEEGEEQREEEEWGQSEEEGEEEREEGADEKWSMMKAELNVEEGEEESQLA